MSISTPFEILGSSLLFSAIVLYFVVPIEIFIGVTIFVSIVLMIIGYFCFINDDPEHKSILTGGRHNRNPSPVLEKHSGEPPHPFSKIHSTTPLPPPPHYPLPLHPCLATFLHPLHSPSTLGGWWFTTGSEE